MTAARWSNAKIFLATYLVAATAVAIYLYLAVNNWHWEWVWCEPSDNCSTGVDLGPIVAIAIIAGGIVSAEVLALATPGRARLVGLAMIPVLAFTVGFLLVPEIRQWMFA